MCFTIIPEERNQRKCAKLSKNQSSSFLVEHLIFSKSKPVRNSSTFFFFVLIPAIHNFCLQEASIRSFWSHYILRKSSPNFWFIVCVHALFVPRSSFSVSFLESSLPLFLPGIISCSAFSPSVRGEKKKKAQRKEICSTDVVYPVAWSEVEQRIAFSPSESPHDSSAFPLPLRDPLVSLAHLARLLFSLSSTSCPSGPFCMLINKLHFNWFTALARF